MGQIALANWLEKSSTYPSSNSDLLTKDIKFAIN
ncbi:hypothetical protein N473_17610 [Pseudoalteromonas luteoviolacea CPMOR-1]|uniref:Uncharacterized protein n=1 Tax=Pseudoalteromonas luteoviolacea CPMOR-1 TaxID=1365248 RepID=A0A167KTI4_9GAMM|nr:hypothetical protein N473_17610 [Pseudoalteromonas luteoviolacea CPMOR-1]